MPIYHHTTGFTHGEIDESLWDRVDVDFYAYSAKMIDNWLPTIAGGLKRRPVLKILPVLNDTPEPLVEMTIPHDIFLQTFVFDKYYVMVRIRSFYTEASSSIVIDADLREEGKNNEARLANATVTIDVGTQLKQDDILSLLIDTVSVGPSLFITCPYFAPHRIFISLSPTPAVTIEEIIWYEELLGSVAVSKNTSTWTGTNTLFQDQLSTGAEFYFEGVKYTVATITSQTSMTTTTNYTGNTIAGERLYKEKDSPFGGNPRLCTFFKNRLFIFSTASAPTKMWASKVGNPYIILPGSTYDDSPIEYELFSEDADKFLWVATGENIYLGGSQAEYMIATTTDGPLTPTNFGFTRISSLGGTSIKPVVTDSSIIFVSRDRSRIFAVIYDYQRAGFLSNDITLFAPHLFTNKIRNLVFRPATGEDQVPRLYVLTDANEVRSAAIAETQKVVAWGRMTVAEAFSVKSVAANPTQVFFAVQDTTIEDSFVYAISYIKEVIDAKVMDFPCEYTLDENKQTGVISFHMNKPVFVISENKGALGFYTITDVLDLSGIEGDLGNIYVGIPFISKLILLPVVVATSAGNYLNKKIRLLRIMLSLRNAYQLFINDEPLFGVIGTQLGREISQKEGVFERRLLGWVAKDEPVIESASVYPATILSITREVNI